MAAVKDLAPAVIQTKAHQRTEVRLEVMLSNSVAGAKQLMRCRPLSHDVTGNEPQQVIVSEGQCCHVFTLQLLVHGQVTIIFVSVCLSVCLFVQSFSQPSLIRFRSN